MQFFDGLFLLPAFSAVFRMLDFLQPETVEWFMPIL